MSALIDSISDRISDRIGGELLQRVTPRPIRLDPVVLPADELMHPHNLEWWYFVTDLARADAPNDLRWTIGFIVLKQNTWLTSAVVGMVMMIDHQRGKLPLRECFATTEQAYREDPGGDRYRFDFEGRGGSEWTIRADSALNYALRLREGGTDVVDLQLDFGKAHLLGDRGIVDYRNDRKLAYYMRPDLKTRGALELTNQPRVEVVGSTWLERQWGDVNVRRVRWKYLLIRLDNGERFVFFRLVHLDAPGIQKVYGIRIDANLFRHEIPEDEIEIRDLRTVNGYPVDTGIRVESMNLDLVGKPILDDQEFNSRIPFVPTFWEGATRFEGTIGGTRVRGTGMTELANYS